MATKQTEYETICVLNPDLAEDATKGVVTRITDVIGKEKGTFLHEDRWGKKKLSFDVKKQSRGNFTVLHYAGPKGIVAQVERNLRNFDEVYRFLTTARGPILDLEARKAELEKQSRDKAAKETRRDAGEAAPAAAAPAAS